MTTHHFTLHLSDPPEVFMTDEMAKLLFSIGCDDSTDGCSEGHCRMTFDREASSLRSAVVSAIIHAESCGLHVIRADDDLGLMSPDDSDELQTLNLLLQLRTRLKSQDELNSLWQELAHAT